MSKRFGRNQKRAARARIAQLERHVAGYTEAYNSDTAALRKRGDRLAEQIDNIRTALGPAFVGLDPETIAHRTQELAEPYSWQEPLMDGHVTMERMAYKSFDDSTSPVHQMHFSVSLAGRRAGYALSRPTLLRTPASWLAQQIARQLAEYIVNDIRDATGRRG